MQAFPPKEFYINPEKIPDIDKIGDPEDFEPHGLEDIRKKGVMGGIPVIRISASPTACPLRGHGHAGTQNDRLSEAVVLSTGMPIPAQWRCRRRCRDRTSSRFL